ncbi:hypothetical protein BUALT_Bualt17G0073400 [Buddleja alternifolia]|uniref:Phosphate transporter PHO1 n=1 Tax=Buddleja alternifolia TaxID=168488 RepID=A0AAV6WFX4_9LAMI|nr:hypothetical protein BUALT_Bualt17G0073400 [Buddleja alternifolia]
MKFGKEFASQMIPEWQEAYMNYNFLKTLLKEIHLFKQRTNKPNNLRRNQTLFRAFSGLTHFGRHSPKTPSDVENQAILVNNVNRNGVEGSETTFLMAGDEGGEYELVYFRRLDDEFNKVIAFYKSKVEEVMKEAGVLNKQMEALIAFRVKVEHPNGWVNSLEETKTLASDVATARAELLAATPSSARCSTQHLSLPCSAAHSLSIVRRTNPSSTLLPKSLLPCFSNIPDLRAEQVMSMSFQYSSDPGLSPSRVPVDVIEEESSSNSEPSDESSDDDNNDGKEMKPIKINQEIEESRKNETRFKKPAPLAILQNVKFNSVQATPRSTIKGFLNFPNQTDLKFTKDNLKKVENQLMKAFVEFYHKLRLLKSYSFLNIMAFSKIMKKYDKITSRSASKSYMKMVDFSYLGSSDEVSKLMERVEVTFIKHFSNSNRSKGMNILRPKRKSEQHRVTFSMGFLVGCTIALILALILIVRARKILDKEGRVLYMETMFPLYSLFGFIVLHMLIYAGNIYFWRRYQVNYSFIFGFKQGTELRYREVLLLGFCLSVLALASILANLDMEMNPVTHDYKAITELLPLGLVVLVVVIMLCPLNIIYQSSRYFLLVCLFHSILAPLYKVTLPDFWLADQLTSQVQALRSLEFYICYYGWGDYKHRQNSCGESDVFNTFSFIIAGVPYWWRLLQCLRRLYDEKDAMHGYNGVKFFLTIVAVCARTAYTLQRGTSWWFIALITSIAATILSMYWDIVLDWGLLQHKSKNRWLRDKLLIPHKSVYFVAIALNLLLRLAWMQTVLNITVFSLNGQTMTVLVASLEIIRRGVWNFFRLENEHLNNVGKFRAFKTVPLPFNYDVDEDKDE